MEALLVREVAHDLDDEVADRCQREPGAAEGQAIAAEFALEHQRHRLLPVPQGIGRRRRRCATR